MDLQKLDKPALDANSNVKKLTQTEPKAVTLQEPQVETPVPLPEKRGNARKGVILAGLGLGAIAASVAGYHYWQYAASHQETDNATIAGHIYQVSSRIPGTVSQVLVEDNENVKPGQILVKLDPSDSQVKVEQLQASLESARREANAAQAQIALAAETSKAQTTQAQGEISSAQAAVATAQAALAEARAGVPVAQAKLEQAKANAQRQAADYNRYQSLYGEGAIPRQQLDQARTDYQVAQAEQQVAQQGIQQAQAKVAQAQEGVTRAQAQVEASRGGLQQATATQQQTETNRSQYAAAQAAIAKSQATLQEAQLQLSYTQILAPGRGRVGRKNIEVGQRIQAGQPLMAIVGSQPWIVANFKETQLEDMKPGQPVEIKLDAIPNHLFKGKVESFSPASGSQFALLPPDNATGNFTKVVQRIPVKITFDPQSLQGYESRIIPGLSAVVNVEVKEHKWEAKDHL